MLQEELIDRFGLLPTPARALLESHRLRILAKPLGIAKIDASSERHRAAIHPQPADRPG